jgi:hypothetical protein
MLEWIAWVSIGLALISVVVIVVDEVGHPQMMGVMNLVWPVTALYLSVVAVWWYFKVGRRMAVDAPAMTMEMGTMSTGRRRGRRVRWRRAIAVRGVRWVIWPRSSFCSGWG